MSLLLTLEQGPRSQAVRQTGLDKGELVIGRSPEADWQIDDPDMYVSRAHCKITSEQDGYTVTDMSSSGLFIDDAGSPLGAGNSIRLKNGMRLRLGDYIVWVELQAPATTQSALWQPSSSAPRAPAAQSPVPAANSASIGYDDFFSAKAEEEPPAPRPADLPDPFDHPKPGAFQAFERAGSNERGSAAFDDPFSLDPVSDPSSNKNIESGRSDASAFDDGFNLESHRESASRASAEIAAPHARVAETGPPPAPWNLQPGLPQKPPVPAAVQRAPQPAAANGGHASPQGGSDAALRSAFLRGVGLEDADLPGDDPLAEMEKFGREYRMMLEGLMQLLRKRSEEKGNARVAQTVVGASEVNPLKFLPTVDDALATIAAERSPGFLDGEAAITDAIRDLAQHHVRAWRGVQGALRRMIDRFDPAAIEAELKSGSAIETLLAGGRGAKLWELYQKRHREIATSAESRFLGEIGADFRDAYEEE
jgi:type VI secretion system protein ImpI